MDDNFNYIQKEIGLDYLQVFKDTENEQLYNKYYLKQHKFLIVFTNLIILLLTLYFTIINYHYEQYASFSFCLLRILLILVLLIQIKYF